MSQVHFVDQSIRDAQQSLWGNMMRTEHIAPIAETMDRVGYLAVATVGSQAFTVQVRNLDEDPWERLRLLARSLPNTCLRGSYQTASLSSFDLGTPRDVISLWIKRNVANGVRSFWICDYQENMERFRYFARVAKAEGAEIVTSLMWTSSPLHTDEHWVAKTRLIAEAKDCVDRIMISDESGVITPEETRRLVGLVRQNCADIPLEFHCHCTSGLAPVCYLAAVEAGVTTLHTAVRPLANGTSLPATETVVKNLRRLGYECDVDDEALAAVSAHFQAIAEREGLPLGRPQEYDVYYVEHQVPGGMMTNLTRQLREIKMEHRLGDILEEVIRVRQEYGYPVMATPYSQIVGAQAFQNLISPERYGTVTDESIKYVLGYYGEPAFPIDPRVLERVMSLPRTREFLDWKPESLLKTVADLRAEIGPELSDDDLLLKVLIPGRPLKRAGGAKPAGGPGAAGAAQPAAGGGTAAPAGNAGTSAAPAAGPSAATPTPSGSAVYPREFSVEVDGDVFSVRITAVGDGAAPLVTAAAPGTASGGTTGGGAAKAGRRGAAPDGAVLCGAPGLILAVSTKVGDTVTEGDEVALIETMKMKRSILSPRTGVVQEVCAEEGQMVDPDDVLLVVA